VSERVPPIEPVRVRAAGATDVGPQREHNEDDFGFFEDATSAIAVVADGLSRSDRAASGRVVETCATLFRGRSSTILDELAETWWRGEHGDARVRPFSTLPIRERVELRDRVRLLLDARVPETLGDAAVLEAEVQSLLAIGARALERANAEIHRLAEKQRWQGLGATAASVMFAAGRASIAHVGDCRVYRVRGTSIERLTREHTPQDDPEELATVEPLTPEQLEQLPMNMLTRLLGWKDKVNVATQSLPLEKRDLFLLATDGLWRGFSDAELAKLLRAHRTDAAAELIERGKRERPDHPGDNLTAVVVDVL
jgi:serine/threonine protein phosphatase PrpC